MITLRPAEPNDVQFVYDLRMREDVREHSLDQRMFGYPEHIMWFAKMVPGPGDTWVGIIEFDQCRAGVLTLSAEPVPSLEVGIMLLPEYRGNGLATFVLGELLPKDLTLWAVIKPENRASQIAFTRAGFIQQSKHIWLRMPWYAHV